jgi:hypothetical protein
MSDIIYKFPLNTGKQQVESGLFTLVFLVLVAFVIKYKWLCPYNAMIVSCNEIVRHGTKHKNKRSMDHVAHLKHLFLSRYAFDAFCGPNVSVTWICPVSGGFLFWLKGSLKQKSYANPWKKGFSIVALT